MSEAIAQAAQRAIAAAHAEQPSSAQQQGVQPVIEPRIKRLFMLLHGRYGTAFTSRFATGKLNAQGQDRGTLSAMVVWQADLKRYADDVLFDAAQKSVQDHPTFPPSLPEFAELCRAVEPVKTYAEEQGWQRLPAPAAEEQRIDVDFERKNDLKNWARKHLARHKKGIKVPYYTLNSARMAMGLQSSMDARNEAGA